MKKQITTTCTIWCVSGKNPDDLVKGTVVGGLLAWCPWGWHQLEVTPIGHPASPIGGGIFVGRYRPQIPRALGCQRGLALADLGCTVDHLDPAPANLIPPSSFAVSCDLKALWPGVLGCWGMGGKCTTWPINPPEVYTSFGPDPPGRRQLAVLVSQSAGGFVHSHCVPMWDGVSVDTVFYRIIRLWQLGHILGEVFPS